MKAKTSETIYSSKQLNEQMKSHKAALMFDLPCICLSSKVTQLDIKITSLWRRQIDNSCKTKILKSWLLLETTEVNDAKWIMISFLWFPPQYFIVSDDLLNIKGVVASIFHWRTMQEMCLQSIKRTVTKYGWLQNNIGHWWMDVTSFRATSIIWSHNSKRVCVYVYV